MDANKKVDRTPLVYLVIGVCLAGGFVALIFGALASIPYSSFANETVTLVGLWWGAFTGSLAGAIWCLWMIPRAMRSPDESMVRKGALAGIVVGVVSTILLHAGLMIVSNQEDPSILTIGLLCGVVAGWIVGGICGGLCRRAVNRAYSVGTRTDDQKAAE